MKDKIARAVMAGKRAPATTAAKEAVAGGQLTLRELYLEVLAPLLVQTGAQWQSGSLPVWREHQISNLARAVIEALGALVEQSASAARPIEKTIILACPAEEYHDLWPRMLADLFEEAGWRAVFIGADTPTPELAAAARELAAEALVLSISTHFHRVRLRAVVAELLAAASPTRLWVTGSAFSRCSAGQWTLTPVLSPANLERFLEGGPDA